MPSIFFVIDLWGASMVIILCFVWGDHSGQQYSRWGRAKVEKRRVMIWISLDRKVLRIQEHILRAMSTLVLMWVLQLNRSALWLVLSKFGCPQKFVNILKAFHKDMKARVKDPLTVISRYKQLLRQKYIQLPTFKSFCPLNYIINTIIQINHTYV